MPFNTEDQLASRVIKLNEYISKELSAIANESNGSSVNITSLIESNKHLQNQLDELQRRHVKLQQDYSNSIEAMELLRTPSVTATTVIPFDSAIHTHKPMRPITKQIRADILNAYDSVYKQIDECKTLNDFYNWIQNNICASASRSEIEGVIYNRFDERLYQ